MGRLHLCHVLLRSHHLIRYYYFGRTVILFYIVVLLFYFLCEFTNDLNYKAKYRQSNVNDIILVILYVR